MRLGSSKPRLRDGLQCCSKACAGIGSVGHSSAGLEAEVLSAVDGGLQEQRLVLDRKSVV